MLVFRGVPTNTGLLQVGVYNSHTRKNCFRSQPACLGFSDRLTDQSVTEPHALVSMNSSFTEVSCFFVYWVLGGGTGELVCCRAKYGMT